MTQEWVNTGDVFIWRDDSGGGSRYRLDNSFNQKTGEPNRARVYTCKSFVNKWYGHNDHDFFVEYCGGKNWYPKIKSL